MMLLHRLQNQKITVMIHFNRFSINNLISLLTLTFLLAFPFLCDGTLSKSNPKKAKPASTPSQPNIPTKSVFDRGLVKEKFKPQDILDHHSSICKSCSKTRQFTTGASLAYVTPWNSHGYDVAKDFTKKFTHISPVWLQLKFAKGLHLEVTGTHDIDADWAKTLKRRNKKVKIVPRLLLDGWTGNDYSRVLASEDAMASVAKFIANFLRHSAETHGDIFDGIVLETSWLAPAHRTDQLHLLVHIGDEVKSLGKELILVIPPASPEGQATSFGAEDFNTLRDSVDYFSLMTYDYPLRPGPNAPIQWVKKCVQAIVGEDAFDEEEKNARRRQLLVGMNFYGYKYGRGGVDAILGSQLVTKLSESKFKVEWKREAMEHKFTSSGSSEQIYFPSLFSIQKRLELFAELGTGLSIWEIGQGLEYFYELL